ncbi:IS3 family transposase [Pectobacterium sp. LFLA-215]|uniref:IS3 family transposase n=1 Tax=Pectobacterium sp. LFLA-215 TaxID=3419008 RepID=UPI003F5BDCAC
MLEMEWSHDKRFIRRKIMKTTVFNYIECDYNRLRYDSMRNGCSPEPFETRIGLRAESILHG